MQPFFRLLFENAARYRVRHDGGFGDMPLKYVTKHKKAVFDMIT